MFSGFINLYKNSGLSSNKALSILKYKLKQNNIKTKVGHFGTLDPMAEGVLPVALGRATRLFDYSLDKLKVYEAEFLFGTATDTLDSTGVVIGTGRSAITEEEIKSVIPSLVGEVEQVPPAYSAKSVNGVRAYKLARSGEEVVLPAKKVNIYSIEPVKNIGEGRFLFRIECGGGTYIRSIVRDMASALGTVGVMTKLVRVKSGRFSADTACDVDKIENIEEVILPITYFTDGFVRYDFSETQYGKVKNGLWVDCDIADGYVAAYYEDELLGIAEVVDKKIRLKTWLL